LVDFCIDSVPIVTVLSQPYRLKTTTYFCTDCCPVAVEFGVGEFVVGVYGQGCSVDVVGLGKPARTELLVAFLLLRNQLLGFLWNKQTG